MGLEQVGDIVHEVAEYAGRVVPFPFVQAQDAVQEPSARVAGLALEQRIQRMPGFRVALLGCERDRALQGVVRERSGG